VDVSLAPFRVPVVLRLVGITRDESEQARSARHIQLRAGSVRLDVGLRLERRQWWVQPSVGAGLAILGVTAPELPEAPSVTRVHAAVALGIAGGVRLKRGLSVRLEVCATAYPSSDVYVIEPMGAVGESPWIGFAALGGLELDVFK